jgi:xanthine/CO dehydrogenase XdhC/CoxF family maturation factor
MALATVVGVEGSAYRRPGAHMLIAESGETCGTISGGCLERDVLERAAWVMKTGAARLIEYDTRGHEDIVWGLGMGCNGVVRVLLESLHEGGSAVRALRFVADCLSARQGGVCATVIACQQGAEGDAFKVGARLLLDERLEIRGGTLTDERLVARVREDALEVLACKVAAVRSFETGAGRVEIFFDLIRPPRPLVIFGAEHDALPLVEQARVLGWHVTVVDTRARRATVERFARANEVVLCRAEEVAARVSLTENTAAVVMTHNYPDDIELLRALLPSPVCYLGLLGPKQRAQQLLAELQADEARPSDAPHARLHSPVGLDIGAETPEEIALAIVAEIKAVCAARGGGFLRDRDAPIHEEQRAEAPPYLSGDESASLFACHSS